MAKLPIPFDNPATYAGHSGVDFGQKRGTPFRASGDGRVTVLSRNDRGGFYIWVHYDAIGRAVGYHHMDSHSGCPRVGTRVQEGTLLGYVGNTGNSTGPHLHSEVEGYATTAGYWRFFDPARVVGGATAEYPALALYGAAWVKSAQQKLVKLGYDLGQWGADGKDGNLTQTATKDVQRKGGLKEDGVYGPDTNAYVDKLLSQGHPPFPLPAGFYFGPEAGPSQSVSGHHGYRDQLKVWQQRMKDRGWDIEPDGLYGFKGSNSTDTQTGTITKSFQAEKGLKVDGLIGPETWDAAWTAPITPAQPTTPTTKPEPTGDATPRTPVYPGATRGWTVPLSSDRSAGVVVSKLIVHHTTNPGDEEPYFKRANERSSCPTWYVKANGEVIEMIAPDKRPSSTGSANNTSVAIEIQNTTTAPGWETSAAALEAVAKITAWLSQQAKVNGIPFAIELDREHIIGHSEAGVNATACPGPFILPRLGEVVARAAELAAPLEPQPAPDTVPVERSLLQSWLDKLKHLLGAS